MYDPIFINVGPLYGTKVTLCFKKLLLSECCTAKYTFSLRIKFNPLSYKSLKSPYFRKIEYQEGCLFDKNVTFCRHWPGSIQTQVVTILISITLQHKSYLNLRHKCYPSMVEACWDFPRRINQCY